MGVCTTIFTGTSRVGALLASANANDIGTPGPLAILGVASAGSAVLIALQRRSTDIPIHPARPSQPDLSKPQQRLLNVSNLAVVSCRTK